MPGLVPGIHAAQPNKRRADGRVKPGHDGLLKPYFRGFANGCVDDNPPSTGNAWPLT